jgi:hypothetical protein
LTGAVNSLFTDINDHAILIVEIIMKRESEYFAHMAVYMPDWNTASHTSVLSIIPPIILTV